MNESTDPPREANPPAEGGPLSVLFVCLGNICRSPLADGVLKHLVEEKGLGSEIRVDSAGTGAYHVGEPPDSRSRDVARKHGVELEGEARQLQPGDLTEFDYVVAMDRSNLRNVEELKERTGGTASVHLLREFDPEAEEAEAEVPDPYYGGAEGFQRVYRMVDRSCRRLLDHLQEAKGAG